MTALRPMRPSDLEAPSMCHEERSRLLVLARRALGISDHPHMADLLALARQRGLDVDRILGG